MQLKNPDITGAEIIEYFESNIKEKEMLDSRCVGKTIKNP